ncbi:hypothetical protein OIU76_015129 [Salix suchowensis]|nr:hypothetical protein OIU76_015129 [Salix suchowensis]
MAIKSSYRYLTLISLVFTTLSSTAALLSTPDINSPPHPKAISDLKEAIVKSLGFQADDFKISGFDLRDALVGHSVAYEFDVEVDNKVFPFKLLEDVNRWEFVDLPVFRVEDPIRPGDENGLVEQKKGRQWISCFSSVSACWTHGDMDSGCQRYAHFIAA